MKTQILTSLLILLFSCSFGQKTIKELSTLDAKKFDKKTRTATYAADYKKGLMKYYQAKTKTKEDILPTPKKVGLYTFYLSDFSQMSAYAMKNGGLLEDYLTESGGDAVIDAIYKASIEKVKETLAKEGFEVNTPAEYLNTPEAIKAYNETELEISKLGKAALKSNNFFTKAGERSPTSAEGYALNEAVTLLNGTDMKLNKNIGYVITGIGMDAIISIQIITNLRKKKLGLQGVKVSFHGANPLPDEIKWVGSYYSGILLGYAELMMDKPIEFAVMGKSGFDSFDAEGLDDVISKLVTSSIRTYREGYLEK